MSASKLLARLQELSEQSGKNYYERIHIADTLLQDREWLKTEFVGDDYKAAESLEAKYFHDLSGSMTVWMLLQIYRRFPNEKDWQKCSYNLRTLYGMCKPAKQTGRTRAAVKVAEFEKVQEKAKEATYRMQQAEKQVQEKESGHRRLAGPRQEAGSGKRAAQGPDRRA